MKIEGHRDKRADIRWLARQGYDSATVIAEELAFGLRELDPSDRRVVGLAYCHASRLLPRAVEDVSGAAAPRRPLPGFRNKHRSTRERSQAGEMICRRT